MPRDAERLADVRKRVNHLPLGAAELAGTSYPPDREAAARTLGFDGVCQNSLDAVSDRDFALEFSAFAAICMVHVSRLSEEVVLWMSQNFGFTDLADYLVEKGLPFRDAHEAVAHAVKVAMGRGVDLAALPLNDLQAIDGQITADVAQVLTLQSSLNAGQVLGGTAPAQVRQQIARHRLRLKPE